jgi:hypothetical protein
MRCSHPPLAETGRVMMRHRSRSHGAGRPTNYEIVVRGELSQRYSTAFEGMALEAEYGQTTITGPVVDQAHLHGLLDRVRDLGLELVSVNATLLVYWAAEGYAELLGEHAHAGRLPTWSHVRASLAVIWPMVSASYVPLLALLVARVLGADTKTAATVALVAAVALLLVQGWVGGRASQLRGLPLLAVTLIAGAFGVMMILLKLLITH